MRFYFAIFPLSLFFSPAPAQNMADYTGGWEGTMDEVKAFSFRVELEILDPRLAVLKISSAHEIINQSFNYSPTGLISVALGIGLNFKGELNNDQSAIHGFIQSGLLLYHVELIKSRLNTFVGAWNILMVKELINRSIYLSIENGSEEQYQAYPVFGDNRFTGTWCTDFQKNKDQIFFTDFKTGLKFAGRLLPNKIKMDVKIGEKSFTQIEFKRSESVWQTSYTSNADFNFTENKWLRTLEDSILNKAIINTHAVLLAQDGKIVYEKYYGGFDQSIPHDMRSASKSISSAIVGITIDKHLIRNTEQSIYDFLPRGYQSTKDSVKAKISLHSLLTMSSGLDAVDFGVNRFSTGSEDNYQSTPDWTKTILNASMINPPDKEANYGSANPYLLGVAVDSVVDEPVEMYMDKNLFQPLKISNYIIQTDLSGRPYFGGGMYLTPADMLKFGQLYLNEGTWAHAYILSKVWVTKSFNNYLKLENTVDKNGYGYLWWHKTYVVHGQEIRSMEARGAGGQYIFVVPQLKAVAVITSGNFRNGKFQQPEMILEKYLLPYVLDSYTKRN